MPSEREQKAQKSGDIGVASVGPKSTERGVTEQEVRGEIDAGVTS